MPRRTPPAQIESVLRPKIPADYETCERWQLWLDYGDEPYRAQCIEFQLSHSPRLIPTPDCLLSPMVFRVPATLSYARRAIAWAWRTHIGCPADILEPPSNADDANDDSSPAPIWR
jgi:hypothetical protein